MIQVDLNLIILRTFLPLSAFFCSAVKETIAEFDITM